MICPLYSEPTLLFFTNEAPTMLYYSHIPAGVISLIFGLMVLLSNPKKLLNQLFFGICLSFFGWTITNLTLWTNINSEVLVFLWSFLAIFGSILSVLSVYFVYVYLNERDINNKIKLLLTVLIFPILFFAPSYLNITGYNLTDCDAFGYEGQIYKIYLMLLSLITTLWVICLLIWKYRDRTVNKTKLSEYLTLGWGMGLFMILFFSIVHFSSFLVDLGILEDSWTEFYGLFAMIIFLAFISYNIVTFRSFNITLLGSQVLIFAILILIASQFTFSDSITSTVLTAVTLIFSTVISFILIRSIKKEIKQREQIEKLAQNLEKANTRLKILDQQKSEFVSIASHQLRSPLAAIRGYVSMAVEGSFGPVEAKLSEALGRISESGKLMADSIEDFLNVSRIEGGNMKFEYSDFNIVDQVKKITEDLHTEAEKHGLVLEFKQESVGQGIVHADIGKTQQIIHNLINNALKYTPTGSINVVVRDDKTTKKLYIDIIDTGIGMSQDTIDDLFQKFSRASNANSVNIKGTGLGLYVARELARAMKGEVTAHSDGDGKGSRFTFEIPAMM